MDSVISLLNKAGKSPKTGATGILREFLLSLDDEIKETLIHRGLFISEDAQKSLQQTDESTAPKKNRGIALLNSLRRKTQKL